MNEDNDNVNVAILARQVNAESTVLDIGCGEGKFGAMLLNKKCQLYGIDIDSEACRNASEKYKYNKIFCTNIEAPDYADEGFAELESLSFEFDYIALIDILEHVINPTRVIENSVRYLKDKGKILISVPNVNNADIFLNLLNDHLIIAKRVCWIIHTRNILPDILLLSGSKILIVQQTLHWIVNI